MTSEEAGSNGERDVHVREAFSLLADETRLGIVEYLRDADEPASYAAIRNALGIQDSGRFNYHLSKLTGTFVRKSTDGYSLTFSATALYQVILSTRPLSEHPSLTLETGETCPECNAAFRIRYEDEVVVYRCPNCVSQTFSYPFPAGGFDGRTDEAALRATVQRMYHHISLAQQGVCPFCSGRMTATWVDDHDSPLWTPVVARRACALCGMTLDTGLMASVQHHAAVVSLFADHDLDPRRLMPWEFLEYVPPWEASVASVDPLEATVPVVFEAAAYRLRVTEREHGPVDVTVDGEP